VDIAVASVVTVLTAPVLLLAAIAVKLEDRGPVLFRQERVGRDGVPFVMLKLRSMVPDAEARQAQVGELNERSGPLFKASDDPRVTRVGRILRATSIDELPQLFNVLRGSMSLVGPRPALASEVEHFDEALQARTRVMPGVTGLWQVEARDSASFADYRRLDLFYLENWSVGFDLVIMLSTVLAVPKRALRSRSQRRRRAVAMATTSLP
jgi:lipopolysaccharide/colanic/teichoic acid biosynthesis glycosyltransferase